MKKNRSVPAAHAARPRAQVPTRASILEAAKTLLRAPRREADEALDAAAARVLERLQRDLRAERAGSPGPARVDSPPHALRRADVPLARPHVPAPDAPRAGRAPATGSDRPSAPPAVRYPTPRPPVEQREMRTPALRVIARRTAPARATLNH